MKRVLAFVVLFLMCTSVFANASLPNATSEFYVADYANLFSEETKEFIVEQSKTLYGKTGAQIVVATVDNMEGKNRA